MSKRFGAIVEGWTGYGQTNHLLKMIACYGVVFQGLKGQVLIEYIQRTTTHCPIYQQWCRHQHEITMRCTLWARATEGYYRATGTEGSRQGNIHQEKRVNSVNQDRAKDDQSRTKAAYDTLQLEGRLPEGKTARERAIIEIARCSKQTTRKYIHLWYPEQNNTTQKVDDSKVCIPDAKLASANFELTLAPPQESLKPLSENDVHTSPYMKGVTPALELDSDFSQISSFGGVGGYPQRWGVLRMKLHPRHTSPQKPLVKPPLFI